MTNSRRSSKRCSAPEMVNASSRPIKPNIALSTVANPPVPSVPFRLRYRKPRSRPRRSEISEPTKNNAAMAIAKSMKIIERNLRSEAGRRCPSINASRSVQFGDRPYPSRHNSVMRNDNGRCCREVGCKLDQESAAPMQAAAAVMEVTMSLDEPSAAASRVEVANDVDEESLAEVMRVVPLGAGVLAGSAVALLVLGYLAIYLLVFLPRGTVG